MINISGVSWNTLQYTTRDQWNNLKNKYVLPYYKKKGKTHQNLLPSPHAAHWAGQIAISFLRVAEILNYLKPSREHFFAL